MSQIIPLGIGSPADIARLILTGLSPAVLPPPPTPGDTTAGFGEVLTGQVYASFNQFSSLIFTDGTEFTLGPRAVEVTWQTIFGSVPAVVDIVMQVSLDGITWGTVSESTSTSSEVKSFKTSARFVRAAMLDMSEGIIVSVLFVARPLDFYFEGDD